LALAVSGDGSVIVGQGTGTSGPQAFRHVGGVMIAIAGPSGTTSSSAQGISNDGTVIVGQRTFSSGAEAFRWTSGGGMVGLGDLPGGPTQSIAYGASSNGSTVVGQGFTASGTEAFKWTSVDGMVPLGDLAGGSDSSIGYSVSGDGSIVVGQGNDGTNQAVVWFGDNQPHLLKDLLLGRFIDPAASGWTALTQLHGISLDGSIAVGFGTHNGNTEAFAVIVPEPAALGLLGLSTTMLLRRRRSTR
jgi:probable HAF family extracellular repeat protein